MIVNLLLCFAHEAILRIKTRKSSIEKFDTVCSNGVFLMFFVIHGIFVQYKLATDNLYNVENIVVARSVQ